MLLKLGDFVKFVFYSQTNQVHRVWEKIQNIKCWFILVYFVPAM